MIDEDKDLETNARFTRRDLLARGAMAGIGLAGLTAGAGMLDVARALASDVDATSGLSKLVTGAKKEGHLNVITLPRDWADYGEIMDKFHAKYGLSITDAIPLGSSAQEIQAIQSLKGQGRA
ncbi:MAG TPA: hypothetical protein VF221_08445, partial [Chloroflexota bacterium]